MAFRASIHGWPFPNAYSCPAPGLGIGAPPLPELGLGGGMCWAALDRYLAGIRIDRGTPAPEEGDPLHTELLRRQVSALAGAWPRVRDWHARPDGSWRDRLPVAPRFGGRDLGSMTRSEWPAIRKRLDAGEPVLLTLLAEADGYSRPRAAWQVLATGYTRGSGRIMLSVYDPGSPDDDDVRLGFASSGELDAHLTGGRALRGFFRVPYDRTAPQALRAETFGDRSVIGLNRKVQGRVRGVAGGRQLDLVARDPEGALLHFRRERRRHWEGANVTERHDFGAFELHSDPAIARSGRTLHVFARGYTGDLLHFRLGRTWKAHNRTDQRRAGARFRLSSAPVPVAGSRFRLSVLGRDEDGGLVHYDGSPLGRWRAEQVAGEPLTSDPAAAWVDGTLHVVGRARGGRLVHWQREEDHWTATNVSETGSGPSFRVDGRLSLVVHEGRVHVFARDPDGKLVLAVPGRDGTWQRSIVAGSLTGDPAVTVGPAGLHVFAPTDGGMLHAWHAGDWRSEDLIATRPTLAGDPPLTGDVVCWGSPSGLRAFARRGAESVLLSWTPGADWTLHPLADLAGVAPRHHPGADPTLLVDGQGRAHLVGTDGDGTVVHLEPGSWLEPGADARSAPPLPTSYRPSRQTKRRKPAAAARGGTPSTVPEPEPVEPEPVEPTEREPVASESVTPELLDLEPMETIATGEVAEPPSEPAEEPVVAPVVERFEPLVQARPADPPEPADAPGPADPAGGEPTGPESGDDGLLVLDDDIDERLAEPQGARRNGPIHDEPDHEEGEEGEEDVEDVEPLPLLEDSALLDEPEPDPIADLDEEEAEEEEPEPLPYLDFENERRAGTRTFPVPPEPVAEVGSDEPIDLPLLEPPTQDDIVGEDREEQLARAPGEAAGAEAAREAEETGSAEDGDAPDAPSASAPQEPATAAAEQVGAEDIESPGAEAGTAPADETGAASEPDEPAVANDGDEVDDADDVDDRIDLSGLSAWPPPSPTQRRKDRSQRREAS